MMMAMTTTSLPSGSEKGLQVCSSQAGFIIPSSGVPVILVYGMVGEAMISVLGVVILEVAKHERFMAAKLEIVQQTSTQDTNHGRDTLRYRRRHGRAD